MSLIQRIAFIVLAVAPVVIADAGQPSVVDSRSCPLDRRQTGRGVVRRDPGRAADWAGPLRTAARARGPSRAGRRCRRRGTLARCTRRYPPDETLEEVPPLDPEEAALTGASQEGKALLVLISLAIAAGAIVRLVEGGGHVTADWIGHIVDDQTSRLDEQRREQAPGGRAGLVARAQLHPPPPSEPGGSGSGPRSRSPAAPRRAPGRKPLAPSGWPESWLRLTAQAAS